MTSPTRRIRLHAETTEDGKGLARLRDDLQRAAKGADSLGSSMADTEADAKSLEAQIIRTKTEIRNLGEEFERTGDTSLFGDLKRQRSLLVQMEKIRKDAGGGVGEVGGAAIDFGGRGMRPHSALIALVAGSLAILSPMIGAAIAGAVTGTVGVGGIAGGILSAAKDPGVKSAAKQFGTDISTEFFRGGGTFVQPTIDSLHILSDAFRDMDLASTFAKTAPYVTDLAEGISGFAREFGGSFSRVLDRSGEIIPVVAQGLTRLGDGLGSMIEEMAASEGTIEGIRFLFEALAETAHALGVTVKFLGDRFDELGRFSGRLSGALEDIATVLPGVEGDNIFSRINDQIEGITGNSDEFVHTLTKVERGVKGTDDAVGRSQNWVPYAANVEEARKALEELNRATEESISIALSLDNANLGLAQAMLDLDETLKENGKNWDTTTQKGLDNRRALLQAVEAAERKRQADIASGKSADEANAAYQRTIDKLKDVARKAGISEKALQDLVGDYNINIHVKTHGEALGATIGGAVSKMLESKGRQHGGPVLPDVPYTINEAGQETVTFPAAGMVHPARLTPMISNARPLHITVSGSRAMQILFEEFVREIGNRGGTLAVIGIREG